MKWLYVLIVVPVLSIALSPITAGTQGTNTISSPSGNIHCKAFGTKMVQCTTHVPFRTAVLIVGNRARVIHPQRLPSGPLLTYGDAWGADLSPPAQFQCASEQTGIICSDFGIHGFAISRKRLETW